MVEPQLVSVVIPTYNRARLLERTLESVAAQTYRPVEVLVIDDGSEDDTDLVLAEAGAAFERAGIAFRSQVLAGNSGPAVARNTGLRLATGSFVAFLDSDDLWHPEFLSTLVKLFERYPTCGVAFSGHAGIDLDGTLLASRRLDVGTPDDEGRLETPFESLMWNFPYVTSGTLVRKEALDTVGRFDETLPIWQDADLWLRLGKRYDFAFTVAQLAYYRMHGGNISNGRMDWYGDQLRVTLRHIDDVQDAETRRFAIQQIQTAQVLLQEELMRHASQNGYGALLYNDYAPVTMRFRTGRLVRKGPVWLRRPYVATIRGAGNAQRRFPWLRRADNAISALAPITAAIATQAT